MNKQKVIYQDSIKKMWKAYILLTINEITAVGVSVCTTTFLGDFTSHLLVRNIDKIMENILWIFVCICLGTLLVPLLSLAGNTVLFHGALDHDRLVFQRYLELSLIRQKEIAPGEVQYRLENDPNEFRVALLELVRFSISIPFSVIMILFIIPESTRMIICLLACIKFLIGNFLGKISANNTKVVRDTNTELRGCEVDICSNLLIYLSMGWGKKALNAFANLFSEKYKKKLRKAVAVNAFVEEFIIWLDVFVQILLLLFCCIGIYLKLLTVSELIEVIIIFPTLEKILKQVETCIRNRHNLKEIEKRMEFFYCEEEQAFEPMTGGEIQVKNLSFSYQDMSVLREISFILSKKKVVIYGENGSGKSTLLKLLCGFLTDYQGEIQINSVQLRGNEESWFQEFAYVSQNSMIFEGTLEENIAMQEEVDKECMEDIIAETGLWYLSGRMLKKENVSGGERQRISIARALYSGREWVFMDEPDKHLDIATLQWLEEFIKKTDHQLIYVTHSEHLKGYAEQCIKL